MSKDIKKNIKETFDDLLLIVFSIAIVASVNNNCSRMSKKIMPDKHEKVQNVKDSVANYAHIQQQKAR